MRVDGGGECAGAFGDKVWAVCEQLAERLTDGC
jgi:hypothetical protein